MTFDRAYANGNFTTPGVATILTGTLPWTHRALQLPVWPLDLHAARHRCLRFWSAPAIEPGYVSTNAIAGAAKQGLGTILPVCRAGPDRSCDSMRRRPIADISGTSAPPPSYLRSRRWSGSSRAVSWSAAQPGARPAPGARPGAALAARPSSAASRSSSGCTSFRRTPLRGTEALARAVRSVAARPERGQHAALLGLDPIAPHRRLRSTRSRRPGTMRRWPMPTPTWDRSWNGPSRSWGPTPP